MPTIEQRRSRIRAIWSETTWDEVAAYVGPNADQFRPTWEKQRNIMLNKGSGIAWSFCWPAFLLGFVWFFYRKQWLIGAIVIAVPVLLGYLLPSIHGAPIGIGIMIASIAKSAYLQDALAKIAKIKETAIPGSPLTESIAATGGVSKPAGIVAGIVYGVLVCAVIFAAIIGTQL